MYLKIGANALGCSGEDNLDVTLDSDFIQNLFGIYAFEKVREDLVQPDDASQPITLLSVHSPLP